MKSIVLYVMLLTLFVSCTYEKHRELTGISLDIDSFEKEIEDLYQADSVEVFLLVIKEEPYFEEFQVPSIIIYNPKRLSDNTPIKQNDDWSIKYRVFKKDALPFAARLNKHCNQFKYCNIGIEVRYGDNSSHYFSYDRTEVKSLFVEVGFVKYYGWS